MLIQLDNTKEQEILREVKSQILLSERGIMGNVTRARRDHKDTLFRMLFSTKENLLSLYNAVNHSHYTNPEELEIVTLKNAVYMNMKNDQAFLLDMQLNLYEHQSTWNPNMPLRFLFYVAKEYQMLARNQTLYASALVELPTPHFVVFYNGETEREAESLLKLSHSFKQKTEHPELELLVKVLNINLDKNLEILETCRLLKEYMLLVHKIRQYTIEYKDINQAVEQAVTECINENILADFLRKNRAEAIEVCIFEYDEKRETELIRKAEFAEGEKVGEARGLREGEKRGEAKGMAKILLNLIEKGILTKEQALEQFGGTYEDLEKTASYITLV